MRRLTATLLGLVGIPAKAPRSNHAEIAAWNQAVERRNAGKRAIKLARKAGTNRLEKEHA